MCAGATSAFIGVGELEADVQEEGTFQQGSLTLEIDSAKRQCGDWREHVFAGNAVGESGSPSSSSVVESAATPDKNSSSAANETAEETQDELALSARFEILFDIGNTQPVASGKKLVAADVNKRIEQSAFAVVAKLPAAMVKALSAAHGNFDCMVALGWLIADAVRDTDSPLIERNQAHAVGLKAKREAGKIKTDLASLRRDAMRDVGALNVDNPVHLALREARFTQLAEAQAELLNTLVEVGMPSQAAPTTSFATGSRKRAREDVMSPEDAHAQLMADAEAVHTQAVKDVQAARRDKEDAAAKLLSKSHVLLKITKLKKPTNLKDKLNYVTLLHSAMHAQDKAHIDCKNAELLCMSALLVVSRAELKYARLVYARFKSDMLAMF